MTYTSPLSVVDIVGNLADGRGGKKVVRNGGDAREGGLDGVEVWVRACWEDKGRDEARGASPSKKTDVLVATRYWIQEK
jgi:hypothetical protein